MILIGTYIFFHYVPKEGIMREAEWLYDHYVDEVVCEILSRDWL